MSFPMCEQLNIPAEDVLFFKTHIKQLYRGMMTFGPFVGCPNYIMCPNETVLMHRFGQEIKSTDQDSLRLSLISTFCSSIAAVADVDDVDDAATTLHDMESSRFSYRLCSPELSFQYIWDLKCGGDIYRLTWVQKGYPLLLYNNPLHAVARLSHTSTFPDLPQLFGDYAGKQFTGSPDKMKEFVQTIRTGECEHYTSCSRKSVSVEKAGTSCSSILQLTRYILRSMIQYMCLILSGKHFQV